ncbi:MAG TPA: hydrogenase maturation nickel metallochaperone HypA [Vicinamibacteria bacterium]|nr:hydrogenase maturation nickel metallochaperone HypA [Vicinamibacteria bacterium]
MHELTVAAAVLEWAEEQARVHAPKSLKSIELELDSLSCLNPEALRFGFRALTAGTSLRGVELEFVEVGATYGCLFCGARARPLGSPSSCGSCNAPLPRLVRESTLKIRSIEVE